MPDQFKKLAITFALPTESSDLVRRLREIDDKTVVIFHTGVGRKSCEGKIDNFLRDERPDVLIASGFAGAVGDNLHAGDLFLGQKFSDPELFDRARRLLADHNPKTGDLFTSTSIVDSISERDEIARTNGADAVDMETEFIAAACASRDIPILSLRVVSDSANEPLPAPPAVLFDVERQRTNFGKLITYSMLNPVTAWRLIPFARQIKKARAILTEALIELVRTL